jgi:hypothetical protein
MLVTFPADVDRLLPVIATENRADIRLTLLTAISFSRDLTPLPFMTKAKLLKQKDWQSSNSFLETIM